MNNPIGELFAKSPIKPLQEHMALAQSCVDLLQKFYQATLVDDWENAASLQQEIKQLEGSADQLKMEYRSDLQRKLLMPFASTDAITLLNMQDRLANKAKDIVGLMLGRKMKMPEPISDEFAEYLRINVDAADQAMKAIGELDHLLETGFGHNEVSAVQSIISSIKEAERTSDAAQIQLRASLMTLEASLPPVDVMFYYRIIDWVGNIADIANRVGSRLGLLLNG